jgi:hypothetical protein
MAAPGFDGYYQPLLFKLPAPTTTGWHPVELATDLHVRWTPSAEIESRLDATYYVVARRPQLLLQQLACPGVSLDHWAAVNPSGRRIPVERGYILHDHCLYAQTRDIQDACWIMGPQLTVTTVAELPTRAAFQAQPGVLLLPRVHSSIHRTVIVTETSLPVIVSDAFALLEPHSPHQGLALLTMLHHPVLGEQLWALTSGTTVRTVAVDQVGAIVVPSLSLPELAQIAILTGELLQAQQHMFFPTEGNLRTYWSRVPPPLERVGAGPLLTNIMKNLESILYGKGF